MAYQLVLHSKISTNPTAQRQAFPTSSLLAYLKRASTTRPCTVARMIFNTFFVAFLSTFLLCFVHEVTAAGLEAVCMGIQANTNTIIYTKDSGETNPIEFYAATQDDLFINDVGYRVGTYYWVQKGNSPCETI